MREVEDEARKHGCAYAYTMTFQALAFYEKWATSYGACRKTSRQDSEGNFVSKTAGLMTTRIEQQ
jgi:hypothetical protein